MEVFPQSFNSTWKGLYDQVPENSRRWRSEHISRTLQCFRTTFVHSMDMHKSYFYQVRSKRGLCCHLWIMLSIKTCELIEKSCSVISCLLSKWRHFHCLVLSKLTKLLKSRLRANFEWFVYLLNSWFQNLTMILYQLRAYFSLLLDSMDQQMLSHLHCSN